MLLSTTFHWQQNYLIRTFELSFPFVESIFQSSRLDCLDWLSNFSIIVFAVSGFCVVAVFSLLLLHSHPQTNCTGQCKRFQLLQNVVGNFLSQNFGKNVGNSQEISRKLSRNSGKNQWPLCHSHEKIQEIFSRVFVIVVSNQRNESETTSHFVNKCKDSSKTKKGQFVGQDSNNPSNPI